MQKRSEKTRSRILQAARRLFSRCGYDAAGVAEICAEAGVSKGAFYHHFRSKQALFLAILEEWLESVDKQMRNLRFGAKDVPHSLMEMAGMTRLVFQEANGQLPMFLEFWAQASRDEKVWRATIAPYRRFHQQFTDLIREGINEGSLKAVNAELIAWVILSMAVGILLQGLLDPQGEDWDKVTRGGMDILLNGLKKE
ncbi:MAG TPA: TetR/AcrR family transcriptional regulator [Anaerolineae bacterium]|nr:TetR/AcrR family transcriptional regulator [Anaerolineae bacterium]